MFKRFTTAEVAAHASDGDCWVIINDRVYDVTAFLDDHPGGKAGKALFTPHFAIVSRVHTVTIGR